MKALILAAGYGTRLYPLTENTPKALLPVGDKTILGHLLEKLNTPAVAVDQTVLVTNHRFAGQFSDWAPNSPVPLTVLDDGSTSDEDRLGSIGDLAFGIEKENLDDDLLVCGSDNLLKDDLDAFVAYAKQQNQITLGAYALPSIELASKYGVLAVDESQRITEFLEKPENPPSKLISTAIYFFPRESVKLVLEYASSQQSVDTLGSFIAWLIEKVPVSAHVFEGPWFDIGDLKSYEHAQQTFSAV